MVNIPNSITLLRIALIPVLVGVFYLPTAWSHLVAALVFAIASLTDWVDGYLARLLNQTSKLGAFLDPVADKLIVVVALVLIVGESGINYLAIPAAVIIGREIAISALREWMAEMGKRTSVAVSYIGKVKTVVQMVALFVLLLATSETPMVGMAGAILLYFAAILTLWSMFFYLKVAWCELVDSSA